MNQLELVEVLLELIAKNAEQPQDRLDVPLLLYITACKVNDVPKVTAVSGVAESWDDINLISPNQGASEEIKH